MNQLMNLTPAGTVDAITDFMGHRPSRKPKDVVDIAVTQGVLNQTPYCIECHDWHHAADEHSLQEDEHGRLITE